MGRAAAGFRFARAAAVAAALSMVAGPLHAGEAGTAAVPAADHHQHLFSPATRELSPAIKAIDADGLIALLDQAGIGRAAVLSIAYQYSNPNRPAVGDEYAKVRAENDCTAAQVARHPQRLRGFCSVNPLRGYALDEVRRCAGIPALRTGLKLHFGNSDVDLLSATHLARLREVFALANHQGMAIAVHLRSTLSRNRAYGKPQGEAFLGLLALTPGVPVQIAHLAGAGSFEDPRVDEALGVFVDAIARGDPRVSNLWFDVSGVTGLGNWYAHRDRIAHRLRQLGLERILFGSDGTPDLLRPREAWAEFTKLPLSDQEFAQIAANVAPYLR